MSWLQDVSYFAGKDQEDFARWALRQSEMNVCDTHASVGTQTTPAEPLAVQFDRRRELQACCDRVFAELGPYHREGVYQKALQLALEASGHKDKIQREVPVSFTFQGHNVGTGRIDLLWDNIVVEIKVSDNGSVLSKDKGQLRKYLRVRPGTTGMLVVFHATGCTIVSVAGVER